MYKHYQYSRTLIIPVPTLAPTTGKPVTKSPTVVPTMKPTFVPSFKPSTHMPTTKPIVPTRQPTFVPSRVTGAGTKPSSATITVDSLLDPDHEEETVYVTAGSVGGHGASVQPSPSASVGRSTEWIVLGLLFAVVVIASGVMFNRYNANKQTLVVTQNEATTAVV